MNSAEVNPATSQPIIGLATFAAAALLGATLAVAQTPMVPSTADFVSAASQSDHFEVLEARTALAQTSDPRIRAFAQHMIEDHTRTSQTLGRAAMKSSLGPLPQGLSGDQQKSLSALQGQRGRDFDRTYAKQQVLAHTEALVVERAYAEHGSNVDIQTAARAAVPVIKSHLKMAKQLKLEVGG